MRLLVKNIGTIVGIDTAHRERISGAEMDSMERIDNAWLTAENGVITAFGTMARSAKEICNYYREKNIKVGLFRPKTLYPFPYQRLRELTQKTKLFIDIEMNLGQMLKDVRLGILSNAQISFIGKPVGNWLKKEEIINAMDDIIKESHASIC